MRILRIGICGLVMAAMVCAGFDAGQLSFGGSSAYARRHRRHKHHRKHGRKHHKRSRSSSGPEL
jgi:hypothetical protein